MVQPKKVAIIGMGQFGTLMAKHLAPHVALVPVRRDTDPSVVSQCDAVIFAVSFDGLLPMILKVKKHISQKCVILDVMSIKEKPLRILKKHFPRHEIVGTHPVFGPQSGKSGIAGLPIMLTNAQASARTYSYIKNFVEKKLKLKVIEQTAAEHDFEMAHIQALTHFIGRALLDLKVKSFATNTKSYAQLLELCDLIKDDSWELFSTIQKHNGQAKIVRRKFLKQLLHLEKALKN